LRDDLVANYKDELAFLRKAGADFAARYKQIAPRLSLQGQQGTEDPHVERLIESFAFLAARIHLKLDDELSQITESLLNVLYPHYLAPIPSMSIAQFTLDSVQGKLTGGYPIRRETQLQTQTFEDKIYYFRTCYPVTLWPVEVTYAALKNLHPPVRGRIRNAVLKLTVRCLNNTRFASLETTRPGESAQRFDRLRFYLDGEASVVYPLYEMLFNNVPKLVELRPGGGQSATGRIVTAKIELPPSSIKPVGFETDEELLPYGPRSFRGYRLLTEYFALPEKFLFFDITGLDRIAHTEGFNDQLDILIHLENIQPLSRVDTSIFKLGCTPVVNLFEKDAVSFTHTSRQSEYPVIPDVYRRNEIDIYSITAVSTFDSTKGDERKYQEFYSYKHGGAADGDRTFWYATRSPSHKHYGAGQASPGNDEKYEDKSTDMFLTLVDLDFNPHKGRDSETVNIKLLCTNRDLPADLPYGGQAGDFQAVDMSSLSSVHCLKKPTHSFHPPLGSAAQWRLISHLSLNHLSLVGDNTDDSGKALREILLVYYFLNSGATSQQITGIKSVSSRRVARQLGSGIGSGFVRGIETTIVFDEQSYIGSGLYLFASVLERFLALYASVNSFNELVAKVEHREGELKRWPPRAGTQIIL
jgi:type VI secretion system protein ImpG